jgi:hypothetical protein
LQAYEEKYRDEMKQFAKRSLKLQAEIETDPELYLVELKDKLQRKIKKIPVDAAAALTDPEKKSGTNAYRNFVKANSLEIRKKSSSFAETSKQIAVKWGELTPEEKKVNCCCLFHKSSDFCRIGQIMFKQPNR